MIQNLIQRLALFFDDPIFPWKRLVIGFKLGNFALEKSLLLRQYGVYQKTTRPKELENYVDQETFDKSQAYSRAKAQFSFVAGAWNLLIDLACIHFDVYPLLWDFLGSFLTKYAPAPLAGEITQSFLFGYAFYVVGTVLQLPFDYYYHFVLEQTFGFNKMTAQLWLVDMVKSQLLVVALGAPTTAGLIAIIQRTGPNFFYYIWLFMLGFNMILITIYPIFIVPVFNKLTPLPAGSLKEAVEALARKLKFPLSELQVIDGSKRSAHSNAYFSGLPWKKRIVIFDTLLEKSEEKEVEAVLAHELGHWNHSHTSKLLLVSQGQLFYVFTLFSAFIKNKSMFAEFGFNDQMPIAVGFFLFQEIFSPTEPIVKLLVNSMSRRMEYQADEFAARLGYTAKLGSALIKLQVQNLSNMDADWLYSSYHHSHPILIERLRAINWHAAVAEAEPEKATTGLDRGEELRARTGRTEKNLPQWAQA